MARHLACRRRRRWALVAILVGLGIVVAAVMVGRAVAQDGENGEGQVREQATASEEAATDAQTEGSDFATSSEPTSEFARILDAGEVSSIELIGDSITAGYGTDGYAYPDASTGTQVIFDVDSRVEYETPADVHCWANDLRSYAAGRGVTSFVNRGICGFTMHDLATYKERYVDAADVIFVMLGTNDTVNHTLEQFEVDARESLAYLDGCCQLLVVMTPPQTDWTRSGYVAYFTPDDTARVLDEVCDEGGYLHISNLDVIELDTDLVNADDVHPTTKGSDAIWDNIRETLGLPDGA